MGAAKGDTLIGRGVKRRFPTLRTMLVLLLGAELTEQRYQNILQ